VDENFNRDHAVTIIDAYHGFGSAEQIASADEVAVAIARQQAKCASARESLAKLPKTSKLTKKQQKALQTHIDDLPDGDIKLQQVLAFYKIDDLSEMTKPDATKCLKKLRITV